MTEKMIEERNKYSMASLVKKLLEEYRLSSREVSLYDLDAAPDIPLDPTRALTYYKYRLRHQPEDKVVTDKEEVKIEMVMTMKVCDKQVYVPYSLESEAVGVEIVDDVKCEAIYPVSTSFCKSYVLDAQNVDPLIQGGSRVEQEMQIRKVVVRIEYDEESSTRWGYMVGGYDKSNTIRSKEEITRRAAEQSVYTVKGPGRKMIEIVIDLVVVRPYYTWRAFKHRKFVKYNPRQYAYFTLFGLSDVMLNRVRVSVSRLGSVLNYPKMNLYVGDDKRRDKVRRVFRSYRYLDSVEVIDHRFPDGMTDDRRQFVKIEYENRVPVDLIPFSTLYKFHRHITECGNVITLLEEEVYRSRVRRLEELREFPYQEGNSSEEEMGVYIDPMLETHSSRGREAAGGRLFELQCVSHAKK